MNLKLRIIQFPDPPPPHTHTRNKHTHTICVVHLYKLSKTVFQGKFHFSCLKVWLICLLKIIKLLKFLEHYVHWYFITWLVLNEQTLIKSIYWFFFLKVQVLLLTNRKNIYTFKENNTPTSPKNHKKLPWYKVYLRQDCRILLMAVLVTFLFSMGACLLDWKWYLKMYPHLITIYMWPNFKPIHY